MWDFMKPRVELFSTRIWVDTLGILIVTLTLLIDTLSMLVVTRNIWLKLLLLLLLLLSSVKLP